MTESSRHDDERPCDRVRRAQVRAGALRLLLAQCGSERDEARAWAQAEAHRYWPGYLDVADPPRWLRHEPPTDRPARSYLPPSMLQGQEQVTREIQELVRDLTQILREFDDAPPARRDAVFYVRGFNTLLVEVRALITVLGAE